MRGGLEADIESYLVDKFAKHLGVGLSISDDGELGANQGMVGDVNPTFPAVGTVCTISVFHKHLS